MAKSIMTELSFRQLFAVYKIKRRLFQGFKTDFVHTRLTHSLKFRLLVVPSEDWLEKIIEKYPHLSAVHGYHMNDFGAIVAAAALAHDIGNPPFGHSGEKAIGEYFSIGKGQQFKDKLTPKQWQDLIDFEGNANGFSVLTSSRPGIEGSLRLSYATLGAFTKYPKESLPKKPTKNISDKKYGFFQSDKDFFKEVAEELGMISNKSGEDIGYERHPLAFLVEAADDICYTIIDFEDGINLGLVSEDFALEYLIKLVKDTIDAAKYQTLTTKEDRISYLRALAIGNLINDAVRVFIENEEAILQGKFHFALTDKSKYKAQMDDIIKLSVKNIYQSREVIEKELSGYQIINTLLDKFITAFNNNHEGKATNYDKLLLKILPEKHHLEKENLYDRLLHICHYISMLTDGKAVELFKIVSA
ncbi:MAG: dNTP triphosphohydrolase [Flavobacteriaceae bacterium]